jgi:hypothetical protein
LLDAADDIVDVIAEDVDLTTCGALSTLVTEQVAL